MDLTTAPAPRLFSADLHRFAAEIGSDGPVSVVGGRSAWEVGGEVAPDTTLVVAPIGIVEHEPAEMTVRVGAGTQLLDLDRTLAEAGQEVNLPLRPGGTVGGAVCVGWSDLRRLGRGPLRDVLLEASVVTAEGKLVRCGGPTVKNVTGFDLCRLMVGSLGTLALVGEVVLRTRPRPAASMWLSGQIDPRALPQLRLQPSACLWDGSTTWLCFEGHPDDIAVAVRSLDQGGVTGVDGPPDLPPRRSSLEPSAVFDLDDEPGGFVAEIGVGTIHHHGAAPARTHSETVRSLNQRMKQIFDPTGRLNPGRDPLAS